VAHTNCAQTAPLTEQHSINYCGSDAS